MLGGRQRDRRILALPDSLNEDGSPSDGRPRRDSSSSLGDRAAASRGVSSDGSVVVGYGSNANFDPESFRWTGGGIVGLGDLPEAFNGAASASPATARASSTRGAGWSTTPVPLTIANGLAPMQPAGFRTIGMSRDGVFAAGILAGAARGDRHGQRSS